MHARVAQWLERWSYEPYVQSSILCSSKKKYIFILNPH